MPFTFGQVLNQARSRHPRFAQLILDEAAVLRDIVDDIRELVDESAKIDLATGQHTITYKVDLGGANTALNTLATVTLPGWVNRVYAVQAVYADGTKTAVDVQRTEAVVRDYAERQEAFAWLSESDTAPLAYLEFKAGVFRLRKAEQGWTNITDLLFVVDGFELDVTREDLDTEIPLPDRALIPLAEKLACELGYRGDLPDRWIERQLAKAADAQRRYAEWLLDYESSREDGFDRDLP